MSAPGPLEWPGELMEFQKDGVRVLVNGSGVLLADDMGLGKTIQAAAAMRLLARRAEMETVLVVTPAALLRNWRVELSRWAPELRTIQVTGPRDQRLWKWRARVHVKIVSYETLLSDFQFLSRQGVSFDLICLDEAQRIKNSETAISASVRKIPCARRWALTGTPLENSLDDVRSILSFVEPVDAYGRSSGQLRDDEIKPALKRLQLRRKKSEVLPQLPPKTNIEMFVELSKEQRDEYEALHAGGVGELRQMGEYCTLTDVLALITRLKQVCNFSSSGARSSKLEDVTARLTTLRAQGHKALVFSQYTSEDYGVRRLARSLRQFRPVCYTGDMSAGQRQQAVDTFRNDAQAGVMILSLKAGGVGLNLQCASYVFHFDRWWNPASELQAEDRSHRIGQYRGVSVYKYVCENTIEERIHEILESKKALFTDYVDDVCLDLGEKFTEEELFGLFGLAPPATRRIERSQ